MPSKKEKEGNSSSTRKTLIANLIDRVERKAVCVDINPEEISLTKGPVRPAKWKSKPIFKGGLTFRFPMLKQIREETPFNLSIIRVHRPSKSDRTHFEKTVSYKKPDIEVKVDDITIGDYSVIVQMRGYRPYIKMLTFTPRKREFSISFPLHKVTEPEQELELLRPGEKHPYLKNTRNFLRRFGYLRGNECTCHEEKFCEHLSSALRLFQRTYKLLQRGSLTIETYQLMMRPRCAHPDFPLDNLEESSTGPTGTTEKDPIVFTPNRWDTFNLRYRLLTGTSDISNEWSIIRGAMQTWSNVSPLSFTQTSDISQSHLEFDFRRPSESGYPFDQGGNKDGNVLAHAFFPQNGLVEYDDHEDWGSTSLSAVSVHEIGHALGLRHSSVSKATMYAWYDSGQASLHEVDVRGIKSLYAPIYRHNGPFVRYPLFAFQNESGTDSVTIDLGQTRHFLAWGTITMIDTLADYDRDNMSYIDIFEVDGNRTGWRVSGGDHFGSSNSPANVYEGAYVGYGQRIKFRITSGHSGDLEVAGFAIVLVLN